MSGPLRTRFAPSPTGDLHVGGAWTALASWTLARATGGATVLRVEDIDRPRVVAGSAERVAEDLAWLGFDWDEGRSTGEGPHAPYVQSERSGIYEAAIAELDRLGLVYRCDCSRAEIARAASAPHAGEELVYPGTCRALPQDRVFKRPPSLRLRVPEETITFEDACRGTITERVDRAAGDFVLRRGDGIFAYQLAVAVDDAAMEIDLVVRAEDLLASTTRQLLLMRLLGHARTPRYAHLPMVVGPDGDRLAKRAGGATIRSLRARGLTAPSILGELARGLGLLTLPGDLDAPTIAQALAAELAGHPNALRRWRRTPWPIPPSWA